MDRRCYFYRHGRGWLEASELSKDIIYELKHGKGKIYWISDGVEYSKEITIGDSEGDHEGEDTDDDVDCEHEGEHEGESEGCVFSFSYSGDVLTIAKR